MTTPTERRLAITPDPMTTEKNKVGELLVSDGQMKTYRISCTLDIEVSVEAASEEDALMWRVTSVHTKDDDNFRAGVKDVEIGRLDVIEITDEP